MTTDRPYRRALNISEAKDELKRNINLQFDESVCSKMLEILTEEQSEVKPSVISQEYEEKRGALPA